MRRALAWGALWAVTGALALYFLAPNPWPIESSRANELRASLSVLDRGGPPLLGYLRGTHAPYAIGYSDDQGIYLIVPVLTHALGQTDPIAVFRWLWILAWASTLLFGALLFRSLFRSDWAALLAPPTLLVCILSFGFGDIYWLTAWILVVCMPLLILLARNKPRGLYPALVLIALAAGTATAIRSNAGLSVALATVAVTTMAGGRRWLHAVAIAAVILAYITPTQLVLPAIRAHRDHLVGADLSANAPTSHPLWHPLYVGLGYMSNRYDIHYSDAYGAAAVREVNPKAHYLSSAYADALHKQVDALIGHDPWFVVKAEVQTAIVELSHAGRYILLLALLLPAALSASGPARLRVLELALFLPALAIGALPAIVAVPSRDFELTLLAPLGVLGLLAIGSTAARAQAKWPASRALASGFAGRARSALLGPPDDWPVRATLRVLVLAVAILAPTLLLARHFEAEHERWDRSMRNAPTVVLAETRPGLAEPDS